MEKPRRLRLRAPDVGVVLQPAGPPTGAESLIALVAFVSVVGLARVLAQLGAPPEAQGSLLLLAGAVYTLRLSRLVLWPPKAPSSESWVFCGAVAATVLLSLVYSAALFMLGVSQDVVVTLVHLACVVYLASLFARLALAELPAFIRAARCALAGCVGSYLVLGALASFFDARPENPGVLYAAVLAGDIALLAAMFAAMDRIAIWSKSSEARRGSAVIGAGCFAVSAMGAGIVLSRGTDTVVLFSVTLAGVLVGLVVLVVVMMQRWVPDPADWST